MAVSSHSQPGRPHYKLKRRSLIKSLSLIPWTWVVTYAYLTIMLLVPVLAMFAKAANEPLEEIWRIGTSPIASATYDVTFVTALASYSVQF